MMPMVRCPACRTGFLDLPAGLDGEARCSGCAAAFPVCGGVVDLLPARPHSTSLAQATMESAAIVRIYESRLWRRSLLAAMALGISFDREQQLILHAAQVTPESTVLDLACGPGIYTRPFARQAAVVVGLDLSVPMLRYASRRGRALGLDNIIWIRGDALDLPFAAARFDAVNCCGALHLFPEVPRVLAGVHRVLKPGGRFTGAAFTRPGGRLASAVDVLRTRLMGLHAFAPHELEAQLEAAGFTDVVVHHRSRQWLVVSGARGRAQLPEGNRQNGASAP